MEPFIFASVNSKGTDRSACTSMQPDQQFIIVLCLKSIITVTTKILAIIVSVQMLKTFDHLRTKLITQVQTNT